MSLVVISQFIIIHSLELSVIVKNIYSIPLDRGINCHLELNDAMISAVF